MGCTSADYQGLYTVGQVCAFFLNIYLPDKVGRRWAMFLPNLLQCTGAIISANATGMPMFLFGRWLTGFVSTNCFSSTAMGHQG
jgi:MFS family permease